MRALRRKMVQNQALILVRGAKRGRLIRVAVGYSTICPVFGSFYANFN